MTTDQPSPIAARSSAAKLGSAALAEPGARAKGVAGAGALAGEPVAAVVPEASTAAQLGAAALAEPEMHALKKKLSR